MKQLSAHIGFVTSEGTQERKLEKLRRDLGEVFLAALADPATVGILLNADGTLWQERLHEPEPWRPIEFLSSSPVVLVVVLDLLGTELKHSDRSFHQFLSPTGDTYCVQTQKALIPTSSTAVTINGTAPNSASPQPASLSSSMAPMPRRSISPVRVRRRPIRSKLTPPSQPVDRPMRAPSPPPC